MESTVTFLWWLRSSCRLTQVAGIELILMKLKFKLRVASFSKQFNPEFNLNCIHCFIKSIADSGTDVSFRLNLIPFKLIGYLFWTWSVTRASVIAAVYLLISTCLFESTGNYLHTQANTRDSTENICKLCVEFWGQDSPVSESNPVESKLTGLIASWQSWRVLLIGHRRLLRLFNEAN